MQATPEPPFKGYAPGIVEGSHFAGFDKRIKAASITVSVS
jgi:hypothetical protein